MSESATKTAGEAVLGLVVPGLPHPLLCPEKNPGWQAVHDGFVEARQAIEASGADTIVIYSTMWPSVIGHQIQADPEPEWVHVDELFHGLGSIPYKFRIDSEFAHAWQRTATARGLQARTVSYHGFPIDTGSVVALKLLNPNNERAACIVSSNMYSDRAETTVLGKATADAIRETGRKVAAVVVMTLSNRLFTDWIKPEDDHIHSPKDDEWNRKILEFLAAGRLEDVAQLSREIQKQIRISKVVNFKSMWWLSTVMGRSNAYEGKVHAYAPVYGTGSAVVSLTPAAESVGDKEYDEEDVEVFQGDRTVLGGLEGDSPGEEIKPPARTTPKAAAKTTPVTAPAPKVASVTPKPAPAPIASGPISSPAPASPTLTRAVATDKAPKPVGAYPHARRIGNLLYISGMGPRQPGTDEIPGGPIRDADGSPRDYDIKAQTRAVIENIRRVCEASGLGLENVVDVLAFLVDMDRDFKGYNEVYREVFEPIQATRTTVSITALPTPIAVEFKCVAEFPEGR